MLKVVILFACVSLSIQAGQKNFFPYGSDTADKSLPQGNDEYSELVLPEDLVFPYYGESYSAIYVHTNGLISFERAWQQPQSKTFLNSFPLNPSWADGENEASILIAPFWADTDTSNQRGTVYYRQSQSSSETSLASEKVKKNFPSFPEFSATWVLIATWADVSFYDHDTSVQTDPRNTYQAVLITDGQDSFVFFYYDKVEWTCGTTLTGNPVTGLTETNIHQAVVGFNKGDGFIGYTEGFPEDRTNLPQVSNINEAGSYAFQVSGDKIASAGCSQGVADFVTFPAFGSILGGQKIFLYGPCWDGSNDLICQFWTMHDTPEWLQTVNGTIENQNTAYCVPDPFFRVGEVQIKVSLDGGNSFSQSGVYRIHSVYPPVFSSPNVNLDRIDVTQTVARDDPMGPVWYTAGNDLQISWPQDVFKSNVDIHVLNYVEEEASSPRWQEVFTIGTNVENDGSHSFRTYGLPNVTSDTSFGVIRIQPAGKSHRYGVKLYSDIHPLGYLLEEAFQDDPEGWAEKQCLDWVEREDLDLDFIEELESCPCTLDQALADKGRFYSDLTCNMFNDKQCVLHSTAKHCVMSIFPTAHNSGSKCCYDQRGNLMYAGDVTAGEMAIGSISQRAHVAGSPPYDTVGMVPMLSHVKIDLIPFFHCCLMGDNCMKYLHRRPTADCVNYKSPKSAILFGDPHVITFDGANYTFNGKGDYNLLRYERGSKFYIYGRFEVVQAGYPAPYNSEGDIGGTGLRSIVLVEEGASAIAVMTSELTGIDIQTGVFDSTSETVSQWDTVDFRDQNWLDFDDVGVSINNVEGFSRITSVTVIFRGSRIGVNITRGTKETSLLAISPILPPELKNNNQVEGLLGNWNNNTKDDLKYPNGDVMDLEKADEEQIYEFGVRWETPLTTIFRNPYPEEYRNESSFTPVLIPPPVSDLTTSEQQSLANRCGDITQCRYDYLVTRNRDIAEDTKADYESFKWAENNTQNVTVCKYIPTPENGTKKYVTVNHDTGEITDNPNNFVGTRIIFACGDDLTLTGSADRICEENGMYSGSEGINECIATPCGTLDTVTGGAISIEIFGDGSNALATVICDEGYSLTGASQHECVDGSWTGGKSVCERSGGVNAAAVAGGTIGGFFFVVIVVAVIVLVVIFVKKNKHQPKTANPIKYSSVDQKDMGEGEQGSVQSADEGKPTPAPRSINSDGEKQDKDDISSVGTGGVSGHIV